MHRRKRYKHNYIFSHNDNYEKDLNNNNNNNVTNTNDKIVHERKRHHTPSLSVMKYRKVRLHHGKDSNTHPHN